MKSITSFVCQECGYETPQWFGKCPECGVWNSLKEFQTSSKVRGQSSKSGMREQVKPKTINEIQDTEKTRILTDFSEMDGVLGGGIVKGSVILLAGDPGIGKSTLLLQLALNMSIEVTSVSDSSSLASELSLRKAQSSNIHLSRSSKSPTLSNAKNSDVNNENKVLYVSGEESEEQIKMRSLRINKDKDNNNFLLLSNTNIDNVISVIEDTKPTLVVIDSIQTMESENVAGLSGSVPQVRYTASLLIKTAKTLNIPIILVGHVTKEGMVAGPMILSHMVDVVLFLEGEKFTRTRILKSLKNRFGPVDEIGIFLMEEKGMVEVKNPEQMFLTQTKEKTPGSILTVTIEGTRAFLIELQALAVFSKLPMPRRVVSGIDARRVELLLAVLQKHCRLPFETMDIFVNIVGGLKISDPGVDLAICLALFSSFKSIPLGKTVAVSEVGLLGELRTASLLEKRIKEAEKLGFKKIISTKTNKTLFEVIKPM